MLISFPHLGKLHLALEKVLTLLDIPYLVPSHPGPLAYQLGYELAPEGSCLPFTLVLGNMRESLERGADTVLMLGGSGPCRFGYFAYLAVHILKNAGYDFRTILIDSGYHRQNFCMIKKVSGTSWRQFLSAVRLGWETLSCMDLVDRAGNECLPFSYWPQEYGMFLEKCRRDLQAAASLDDISRIRKAVRAYTDETPRRQENEVLKIGLVGDIYTLLEPYANHRIEEYLVKRGIGVYREMSVSGWVPNVFLPWLKRPYRENLLHLAYPYLTSTVGGFGLESVANSRKMKKEKVDGIIQIFPLGCMPEIVAKSALLNWSGREKSPVLNLALDRHESETGMVTRLEAFLEMVAVNGKSAAF